METKIEDNAVYVKTPYAYKDFVQRDLNGVWSKKHQMYRFPKNLNAMRELIKAFPELKNNMEFVKSGQRIRQIQDHLLNIKRQQNIQGNSKLRCYQRVDVAYLKELPSAGIFNQQRTGKTPTTIQLIKELGTKRNLVIAPASLIWNWANEFNTWFPEVNGYVITGTPKQREQQYKELKQDKGIVVMVISKDTWKSDYKFFLKDKFDTCFVDEAHYLRNYKTAQSKGIFEAAKVSKRRYALTGTPGVKHAADVWGILHFLYPKEFTSFWQFAERYFVIDHNEWGGAEIGDVKKHRERELEELIGMLSVQRKRKEVMPWLPKKQYIDIPVVMGTKQRKLYDRMQDDFLAWMEEDDHAVDTANVLTQLLRLRQLAIDPRLVGFDIRGSKTDSLLEWLDNNREPVVIMSMFTSYLKLIKPEIEALGLKVGEINGEMSSKEKSQAATEFQQGWFDVLLCNTISAGTGLTLDQAETIVFVDKPWNPAEAQQAEDRITPVTEDRNHKIDILTFQVKDSVDEKMEGILQRKESLTHIINHGGIEAIRRLLAL